MTSPVPLMPCEPVPALDLPVVGGGRYVVGAKPAARFDLLVFYRGLHCPICAKYLSELERLAAEFERRGVRPVAISSDGAERAVRMAEKVRARITSIAYDMPLVQARAWGLYISAGRGTTSVGMEEPSLFHEPGVFLVRPDRTLHSGTTQTMPFGRPVFSELLGAADASITKGYPARGEYAGEV